MEDLEPINFPERLAEAQNGPTASGTPSSRPATRTSSAIPGATAQSHRPLPQVVAFDRRELSVILGLYGRKVAEGEWRDYAIDFSASKAVFSIFRRTSEVPLYRIEKDPKLARKQSMYSVVAATGLIMRRGPELARVIAVLDKKLKLVRA
jgi:hypothetical protein